MKLADAALAIGSTVIYRGWPEAPPQTWERGVITSVRGDVVFVRYGAELRPKAT